MAIIITFILCLTIFKYSIEANNGNFSQFVNKTNKDYFEEMSEVNKTFSGNQYLNFMLVNDISLNLWSNYTNILKIINCINSIIKV